MPELGRVLVWSVEWDGSDMCLFPTWSLRDICSSTHPPHFLYSHPCQEETDVTQVLSQPQLAQKYR